MYFDFNAYEAKGGNKEHFLQHVKNSYELENDDFERLENGIKSFNEKNKTNFDLYDYLKYNSNNMKFKKKENLDIKTEPEKIPEKIEPKDEDFEKYKKDYAKQGFWGDVIDDVKDDIFMVDLFSDDRKKEKDYQQRILGEVKEKISQNLDENSLDEAQKKVLKDKGLSFKDLKKRHEIANKDYKDLSDDEKKIIESENGFLNSTWNNFFNEKDANHKEFKEKYNSEGVILKSLQDKLNTINHFHKKNRLATTILNPSVSDEDNKALQKDYLNSVYEVAKFAGFDDIAQDENGGLYLIKDDKQKGELAYKVNEGFFDNFLDSLQNSKFEIASSVAGGIKGFNSGKNPRSKVIRGIAGSALGATVGAGADYAVSSYDKDKDFKDMLDYSINSGTLDLAFGTALSTAGHFIERYGVKEALKKPFAMANKALDYTPLVSTTKNFPTQNIKAAQDLVEKSVDLNTQKELDEFYKAYGGRSGLADSKALDALVDTFKAKFGEDSFISKNTQKLNDILNLNSLSAKQNALFEAIRADESGFLLPYVKEVASYDVRAFKNLKNILNLSTQRLENSLKNMNLNKGDIKNILDELEKGTKEDYNEVMNEILAKTYDDRFKVVLSRSVTPEATSGLNPDSVMTKAPSNYSTLKQNLQEDYDLLDKTKPLRMAREDELNEELLKRAMEGKNKLYIANANLDLQTLGLNNNKDIKITLSSDAMRHILNKHSKDDLPVSLNDFKMIDELINNADLYALSTSKDGQKALLTGKQINGHFIAIETISTKDNELKIKTMYKSNGKLENAKAFKEAEKIAIQRIRPNTSSVRSQVPLYSDKEAQTLLRGYKPDANSFASSKQNYNILNLKTQAKDEDFFNERLKIQELLTEQKGEVVNKNTNETAQLSNKGIKKMLSDKAISKSVDNGFSKMEHLQAVANIKTLFENSQKSLIKSDKVDDKLKIYRYKSDFNINDKDAQALITLKEYDENGKKLYSLELDELVPNKLKSRGESLSGNTSNRPHGTPSSASGSEIPTSQNNYTTFRKNLQEQGLDIDRGERNILKLKTDLKDEDFFKQRDKIIKDLKANKGEVINSYTNESAILSNAGIKKMSSDKAIAKSVDNGFSKMEHLQAVANIKELFRNSKKLISKGDVKNSDNNLIINRYVSDLNVNDKEARALLTLKEYNENGKRFYSLELENLEPLSSTKRGVNGDKGSFLNGDRDTPSFSAQNNYTTFRKNLQEQGLESLVAFKAPKELSLKEIENTINRFDNVENLKKHLESRVDSKERQALFHLLDSTMGEPQLQWIKNNKDKRLKKFQTNDEKEPYFYLLVTKDKDKTFITHLKTRDLKYLSKEIEQADELIKGADIIEGFRQQAGSANNGISPSTSKSNYTKFRQELQEQGLLDEEAMKFLNYVENTIYNPKGVTFTQLNNALKNINSFYKQSTNPGFKEHIKNAAQSFLRDDIKKGINEIFKQDKNLYAKASKLYETSLAEYAQMKELLKASAYKKARNESTTQVKALDELIKYSKGQGKDGLNNLDFLRTKLDEKDVAVLEMNLLNRLYEKSLANTDESLRVFDSTSFLNELSTLQNNAFKSKEANDFIELVKGFDKLFKNDAKIALELAPVTAKKEGSALATSAKGAVLQKIVKSGFDLVFRNLGQNVLFGSFKDQIQGAALRYHLKKALQKSDTISEFNTSFKDRLKKGQFNSKTRELSKDFLNDVENFSKNLDEEINFTMQESKEMPTKTEFKIDENLQAKLNLDTDVLKADLQKLKSTHPELFENKGAVARLINKIKENPTFFFDNNRLDMKLVGAYIKDNFAELGIVTQGKNKGDIGHILETSKAQQRIKSLQNRETKSPLVETATLDTLPYNKADGRNSDISLSKDKDNSTTNVASLSKTRELSKDFLNDVENFSKNLDDEVLKDTKASDEGLKDLPKDLQEQWIKEFNLKSVDEDFIPNFKPEVKEALEKAGITEDLHLKIGSLIKLNNRQRQEFLPYIKPTIQEPNLVLDDGRGILFIKEFTGEDKSRYFMSVAKDYNGEWIFSTHTRKELKAIQNKINNSKQIYNKGFKGEEVAGTSDILKSGGTTTKPSDLQIEYPANHSSGINPKDNSTTNVASLSKTRELEDIKFSDTKGKEHTLTKETQEQWLKTFELENLEQSYIPKHSEEIKKALGKEIRLTKGSLLKLVSKEREQYIPQIKETLDNPDFVLKDVDNMIILAKKIDDKQYFTSINLETDDFLISVSNAPKKENVLKNKIEKGAKVIYQSPNSETIFYTPELLQASQSLANKIDKDNSTTNVASLSKTRELSKDFLNDVENFSKNLDDEVLKDTKASDEGLKDLPKDLQEQWIKEFNLKSVDEDFVPKLPKEIENIFEGGIHLKLGSLIKLQERDRLEFLKKIKPTLQEPDAVLRQNDGAYIFIKDFKQKKYFSTVTRNENGEWVVTSNAPKTLNNIKNKISEGGELVYNTLPELPIIAKPELSAKALNSEGDVKPNSSTNSIKLQANSHIGTGLPTGKENYIKAQIKNSDKVEVRQWAISDLDTTTKDKFANLQSNSTTNLSKEQIEQGKPNIKILSKSFIKDDLLNVDEDVSIAVVSKDFIKQNLQRGKTQFRNKENLNVINNIKNNFNPREHFKPSSNFDGLPLLTKDGLVIAGNHRSTALKELNENAKKEYIAKAKEIYGDDVFKGFNENEAFIVRILENNTDENIERLSKLSNDGRLFEEAEKFHSAGAKYKEKLENIVENKSIYQINNEKDLMRYLGSNDIYEAQRALIDFLIPDANEAVKKWEKKNSGDVFFSKMLNDNAIRLLKLKQALSKNKALHDETKDFINLFARAIDGLAQEGEYKGNSDIYKILERYSLPTLDFGTDVGQKHKDLQGDILGFILRYGDTLTNPSDYLANLLQNATKFVNDNVSANIFAPDVKINNYDILETMLKEQITKSEKYQKLKASAINIRNAENNSNLTNNNLDELRAKQRAYENEKLDDEKLNFSFNAENKHIRSLRNDLKTSLKDNLNVDFTNKQTGIKARISSDELRTMSSSKEVFKSLDNGFKREEYFEVAKNITNIFKNAKLKEKQESELKGNNIKSIYTFEKDIKINGKEAIATIKVFEKEHANNKMNFLRLQELKPAF